jgi:small subunit ribosomal protein S2
VLFVGTKRQAQETVREEAVRCGMPFVTERWMGGILTNWTTMSKRVQELERLERMRETGEINRLTKKEGLLIGREINRLEIRLSGLRKMKRLPTYVFIVDICRETTAVLEANKLEIPVIALVDTNCDPTGIDYVIPSNDDAIRAIKLLVGKIADAVLEGKAMRKDEEPEELPVMESGARGRPMRELDVEEETDDRNLLGESTLAKLGGPREDAPAEPVAEVVAAEAAVAEAAPVAETAPAEDVDAPAEAE